MTTDEIFEGVGVVAIFAVTAVVVSLWLAKEAVKAAVKKERNP